MVIKRLVIKRLVRLKLNTVLKSKHKGYACHSHYILARLRGIGDCDEQRMRGGNSASTNEEEVIKFFAVRGRWSGLFMEGNFMFPLISLSISLFIQLVKQGKAVAD